MYTAKERSYHEWLVVNSQLGDRAAFDTLLKEWQPRLIAYAARRIKDREAARDVVQECLLNITRSIGSLRDPAAFPAWCYQLLERRCVDHLRKLVKERDRLALESGADIDALVEIDSQSRRTEQEVLLQQVLSKLDDHLVILLKLYYQDSLTVAEIAQILDVPVGTVKSRLYYARKTLATAVEER